jgi:hypothetical protein
VGAQSTSVVVDGVDIRYPDNIPGSGGPAGLGYAIGGGWGYTSIWKPKLHVRNVTADRLSIAVAALSEIVVTGNRSDSPAIFEYWSSGSVSFSGNTNLTLYKSG